MRNLWYRWEQPFDEEFIRRIHEFYDTLPTEIGGVGEGNAVDTNIRKTEQHWLNRSGNYDIFDKFTELAIEANAANWGFDIVNIPSMQLGEYHSKYLGFYDWHADNNFFSDSFYDRKISLVLQLSDPSEYEGGNLLFDGDEAPVPGRSDKGSVIAFPSYVTHTVTPVTKGVRRTLVTWIEGPKFR